MEIATSPLYLDKAKNILGWMSERELAWLAVAARKSKRIVEFGSFHGRSTRVLADNSPDDAKIWAVDPWNGDYIMERGTAQGIDTYCLPLFKRNLRDHIDSGKVIPVRVFSQDYKPEEELDLLFIDGNHDYRACLTDIGIGLNYVKEGGIISGHDFNHPAYEGVKQAVLDSFDEVHVEDTIWWTIVR